MYVCGLYIGPQMHLPGLTFARGLIFANHQSGSWPETHIPSFFLGQTSTCFMLFCWPALILHLQKISVNFYAPDHKMSYWRFISMISSAAHTRWLLWPPSWIWFTSIRGQTPGSIDPISLWLIGGWLEEGSFRWSALPSWIWFPLIFWT
jgi:hypothetical protein